jgi:hypothetical protein
VRRSSRGGRLGGSGGGDGRGSDSGGSGGVGHGGRRGVATVAASTATATPMVVAVIHASRGRGRRVCSRRGRGVGDDRGCVRHRSSRVRSQRRAHGGLQAQRLRQCRCERAYAGGIERRQSLLARAGRGGDLHAFP